METPPLLLLLPMLIVMALLARGFSFLKSNGSLERYRRALAQWPPQHHSAATGHNRGPNPTNGRIGIESSDTIDIYNCRITHLRNEVTLFSHYAAQERHGLSARVAMKIEKLKAELEILMYQALAMRIATIMCSTSERNYTVQVLNEKIQTALEGTRVFIRSLKLAHSSRVKSAQDAIDDAAQAQEFLKSYSDIVVEEVKISNSWNDTSMNEQTWILANQAHETIGSMLDTLKECQAVAPNIWNDCPTEITDIILGSFVGRAIGNLFANPRGEHSEGAQRP